MIELQSYLEGAWITGKGSKREFVNPTSGETLGILRSGGIDATAAINFSREIGGATLKQMNFAQRGAMLNAIADALISNVGEYEDIARRNSGNTSRDAAVDIQGGIGTLKYYARLGKKLGDTQYILEDGEDLLTKAGDFKLRHFWASRPGVAICINAFNFPSWGLWEKAAVALLAGVPVIAKPASSTAWLSEQMVRDVIASGAAGEGVLSLLCGSADGLLEEVKPFDHIAFTGSAETGRIIKAHQSVLSHSPRLNIEADSVNAAILGESSEAGGATFDLLLREATNALSIKAGQLCTNIRRILVPAKNAQTFADALAAKIDTITCGDPADESVRLGPLVNRAQQQAALEGMQQITSEAKTLRGGNIPAQVVGADAAKGAFVEPTLFLAGKAGDLSAVHDVEIFGPAITILPYQSMDDAIALAARGGGSLAVSVWCDDVAEAACLAGGLAPYHGRVLCIDPEIGKGHTGHAIVMPQGVHGGPGRAGGGEELGGLRGLRFYMQRTAIQGQTGIFERLGAVSANVQL